VSEPDNIPERVSRLEHSVAEARKDAAAARILAGGADRDVSEMRTELKAHTKLLNALRETQVEQGKEIRDLRTELRAEMREGDASIRAEMREGDASIRAEMREGFAKMGVGMAQITALLTIAIDKPEESDES
jgi:DNA-binding protein H-NS